jgi:hypothetical protein
MGLIDRVARVFGLGGGGAARGRVATTSDDLPAVRRQPLDLTEELRGSRERGAIIKACRTMYDDDPRAEGVIGTLARDIVRGGCSVAVAAPAAAGGGRAQTLRAQEVADALIQRLGLNQRLDDWMRLTLRDGDSFLELSVDGEMQIADVTRKPTLEVRRNSDAKDRFPNPAKAFWQGDTWWMGAEPPADATWFAEWQMIHARWRHDEGSRYGRPLFASARRPFTRITEGETDVAVRRKTRAGLKYVHEFPEGTDPSVIEAYKVLNRDSLDNPTAAIADFFGSVKVNVVQGDAQLNQIDDVLHHIRTWWIASPVPMSLLGYGQDLNRDVLDKQEEQYLRALEGLTEWPESEIVRPLLERQWLLAGIWPAGLSYEIKWKAKQPLTAKGLQQAADAGIKLKALGWTDEQVAQVLAVLLPGMALPAATPALTGAQGERETRATAGRMAEIAGRLGL